MAARAALLTLGALLGVSHAKLAHFPEKDDGAALALDPALSTEDKADALGIEMRRVGTRKQMMVCNLAYYENATSGGGQIGTDCFAEAKGGEAFGRRLQLSTRLALPRNYSWGQLVEAEVVEHPKMRPVALRLMPQTAPRIPISPRVISLSSEDGGIFTWFAREESTSDAPHGAAAHGPAKHAPATHAPAGAAAEARMDKEKEEATEKEEDCD